jgi:hypothetical protein
MLDIGCWETRFGYRTVARALEMLQFLLRFGKGALLAALRFPETVEKAGLAVFSPVAGLAAFHP